MWSQDHNARQFGIILYQSQNFILEITSIVFQAFVLRGSFVYSQYWLASTESGKRFNSKYTTKRQMANHAGNGGTDQCYFSALKCLGVYLLTRFQG